MAAGRPCILVRAVASGAIGAGHVARTSAVMRQLAARGARTIWVCDATTAQFLATRDPSCGEVVVLAGTATEGLSGESQVGDDLQRHDAHAMLRRAAGVRPDAIIVDTYLLGAAWQRSVRDAGVRVVAFDDLADRRIDADIVVNAAGEQSDYQALAPGARHLLGLEYAIAAAPPAEPPDFRAHGAMLVSFGASDSADLTSQVIAALEARNPADERFRVWVQLGEAAPHRNRVLERVKTLPWMQQIKPTDLVDAKVRAIVIAIGASGVSLYERMRDGIPSVVVPLAANQRRIASAAASTGAAMVASGPGEAVDIAMRMLESPQLLKSMSSAGRNAVDGLGAQRVADTILSCIG